MAPRGRPGARMLRFGSISGPRIDATMPPRLRVGSQEPDRGARRVDHASLQAWDFALRGAATGLFLMVALVTVRDGRLTGTTILRPALLLAAAAFAVSSAPTFPPLRWWSAPVRFLSSGAPVLVWLWARAAFDDDFKIRRWHGALWAIVGLVGVAPPALARTGWP